MFIELKSILLKSYVVSFITCKATLFFHSFYTRNQFTLSNLYYKLLSGGQTLYTII